MKKHVGSTLILAVLLALAFGLLCNAEAETITSGNLKYELDENGNATLTGYVEKPTGELIIPAEVEGHLVTALGNKVFSSCTGLTSIEIPDSVTIIGAEAFQSCTGLTSVELPSGLTSIGRSVFFGCTSLTSIELPSSGA